MKPISVDEFFNLTYLSNVTFSPEGRSACLTVSRIDRKKDEYRSCLYLRRNGKLRKLTSFGRESRFLYLDEDTILFPSRRDQPEEGDPSSVWYRISLSGGEAEEAYRFPIGVSKILPLPGGDLIVLGSAEPGHEDLYTGGKKALDAYRNARKENADYEVITQNPWWWNGGSFTCGAYTRLFRYDVKKKKLRPLSEEGTDVSQAVLSPDKSEVYYLCTPTAPRRRLTGTASLRRLTLSDGRTETLLRDREDLTLGGIEAGDHWLLVLASDNRFGLNTDMDFYRLDYADGTVSLLHRWGEAIGSSVGTDIRYGGGRDVKVVGEAVYFIATLWDDAKLMCLRDGTVTAVTDLPGSVECFDVHEGKVLTVALRGRKGQELYDGGERQLSRFNEAALRGKYTAEPEPLNVDRGGYEIHGFVLRPMGFEHGKKYPVILDIHGGPKTVYGSVFVHEMQYWAGKGYFVIFCNPTGSDGRGAFMDICGKYGTVDFEDIMAFCDAALEAYPEMDKTEFFETGGSYGGFMTNWIIGHTDRFRACVSQRSISNWFSFLGVADIGVEFTRDQMRADPWSDPEKLWEHSPLRYADRAVTPTLFIHSFEDYRCPIDQGYQMFTALAEHGVETKMVLFRGENHDLSRTGKPSHRLRRLREITAWFDGHRR